MKRNNKKGFTIVELVVVIAVIAILAAVLIPNLSRLVQKANDSADLQEARNVLSAYMIDYAETDEEVDLVLVKGSSAFKVVKGQLETTPVEVSTLTTGTTTTTANETTVKKTVTIGDVIYTEVSVQDISAAWTVYSAD